MIYAMVLKNKVIGIVQSETPPKWGNDERGNPVTAVETTEETQLGMVYDEETGQFSEYVPPKPQPTQLDRIEGLLAQNVTDIENNAIDRYNLELVKEGVL